MRTFGIVASGLALFCLVSIVVCLCTAYPLPAFIGASLGGVLLFVLSGA